MRLLTGVLLLGLSISVSAASEHPKVIDWLLEMSKALQSENYHGHFIYRHSESMNAVEMTHWVVDGEQYEYISTLSGGSKELMNEGDGLNCNLQQGRFHINTSGYPGGVFLEHPDKILSLEPYYHLESKQGEPIAKRQTQMVDISPKDEFRFGYRLWIARNEPHLLLRSEVVTQEGDVLEQLMFTNLEELQEIPKGVAARMIKPLSESVRSESGQQQSLLKSQSQLGWRVEWLPSGFERRFVRHFQRGITLKQTEHHLYSDGFSAISVFIEPEDEAEEWNEYTEQEKGGIAIVSKATSGSIVTVIGEVPMLTVRQLASSIHPVSMGIQR